MRNEIAASAAGVFRATGKSVAVGEEEIALLASDAAANRLHKSRILLHGDPAAGLHQMLITHRAGIPILPHINDAGAKSYHMVAGRMTVVFFDEVGAVSSSTTLGERGCGLPFLLRWQEPRFHTIFCLGESVCFVETILGPHSTTRYAEWAPADSEAQRVWWSALHRQLGLGPSLR